jgi:hypothetical protein
MYIVYIQTCMCIFICTYTYIYMYIGRSPTTVFDLALTALNTESRTVSTGSTCEETASIPVVLPYSECTIIRHMEDFSSSLPPTGIYICIYIYIYTYTQYIYTYIYIYVYIYTYIQYIYINIWKIFHHHCPLQVCVYICRYIHIYMYAFINE